jgi:glycine/D-amino acid oxidase-like deaminating enzyme
MERRSFLRGAGLAIAAMGAAPAARAAEGAPPPSAAADPNTTVPGPVVRKRPPLAPIKASMDRMISLQACLRPFRPQGPRIEAERMGRKVVVHNYGHGGSGWSLSWGSARRAVELVRETGEPRIAVIGCGAIGLTTAVVAQRSGFAVRIYTKDQIANARSSRATGVWSPSARICTLEHATPAFRRQWEEMARYSYAQYNGMLGLAGAPIEWTEGYKLSDTPFAEGASLYTHAPYPGEPVYPHLEDDHTPDLMSGMQALAKDQHPFPVEHVRRVNMMMFNIPAYTQTLLQEFFSRGGDMVIREFASPAQFQDLPEKTIVHATGYAAKALVGDASLVPVRGQTARFIPQPEVDYAVSYDSQNVYTVPRRDGMIIQEWSPNDYGNEKEVAYLEATKSSVARLVRLFEQMRAG